MELPFEDVLPYRIFILSYIPFATWILVYTVHHGLSTVQYPTFKSKLGHGGKQSSLLNAACSNDGN